MSRHFAGGGRPAYSYIGADGGGFGGAVKTLLIANVAVFALQLLDGFASGGMLTASFGLRPADVTGRLFLWQLATYIFLHADFIHILFNMFMLWMFGRELEYAWGRSEFYRFFFVCGVGAGVLTVLTSWSSPVITIGASGAIYGILLAYGLTFPTRIILVWGILPVRALNLALILIGIAFLMSFRSAGGGVAHVAHLGGALFGYLYLRAGGGRKLRFSAGLKDRYEEWRRQRLRRKFEVYYNRKQAERDRDPDDPFRWKN